MITGPLLIRVFCGGLNCTVVQLQAAIALCRRTIEGFARFVTVEYATNSDVREDRVTFGRVEDLIIWLLGANFFLIASQGIWLGIITSRGAKESGWGVDRIAHVLNELAGKLKNGFPYGRQLVDPVWSGDKMEYILLLKEFVIPTFKIDLTQIVDMPSFMIYAGQVFT
jgi:hypothetical protein